MADKSEKGKKKTVFYSCVYAYSLKHNDLTPALHNGQR